MEKRDFIVSPISGNQTGRGGDRRSVDYHLSIDSAKHVAMMCGTDKGFEVRDYLTTIASSPLPAMLALTASVQLPKLR